MRVILICPGREILIVLIMEMHEAHSLDSSRKAKAMNASSCECVWRLICFCEWKTFHCFEMCLIGENIHDANDDESDEEEEDEELAKQLC